nr:MAG TPA: hypothetical protein [Caudoviricetes sp.]
MDIKDFALKYSLSTDKVNKDNDTYIFALDNSNEYSTLFNKLSKDDNLKLNYDNTSGDILNNLSVDFKANEYSITLVADFNDDIYKLILKEFK